MTEIAPSLALTLQTLHVMLHPCYFVSQQICRLFSKGNTIAMNNIPNCLYDFEQGDLRDRRCLSEHSAQFVPTSSITPEMLQPSTADTLSTMNGASSWFVFFKL